MIGLVIASHGRLAEELVATTRLIIGELPQVATCSVEPNSAPEDYKASLKAAIASVEQGQGVLVFADLIGGSPCTQSLALCQQVRIEVLSGVNLPMLIKANSLRQNQALTLAEFAQQLLAYGQRNIANVSEAVRARVTAA